MDRFNKFILLLFLLSFLGCSDYDQFYPYHGSESQFSFLNTLLEKKTVVIDPTDSSVISVRDSIFLEIPAGAFVNSYREKVKEEIELSFHFYEHFGEFIANGLSAESESGDIIDLKALFFVRAYSKSGHVLELAENKRILIKFPNGHASEDIALFYPAMEYPSNNLDSWQKVNPSGNFNQVSIESWNWKTTNGKINTSTGCLFSPSQLNWMMLGTALDKVYESDITVKLPQEFTEQNTLVYLINKGNSQKILVRANYDNSRHGFCSSDNRLNLENEINLVIISRINDQLFYKQENILMESGFIQNIQPDKTDLNQLILSLKEL